MKAEVEEWRTKARDAETGKGQCTDDMVLVEDELDEVKQEAQITKAGASSGLAWKEEAHGQTPVPSTAPPPHLC